jgi:serine/threonine protein kinase
VRSSRQDEGEEMMTLAGMVLGTPQYMPPEQARGETDKFDARTDIYSLGAMLYHILTLEPPIHGDDMGQMLQSVADGKVAPRISAEPARIRSTHILPHIPGGKIPEDLAAVTRKAMAMEREDRYQTVKELQDALVACQSVLPSTVLRGVTQPGASLPPAAAPQKRPNFLVIALIAVVVVLASLCAKLVIERNNIEAALLEAKKEAAAR